MQCVNAAHTITSHCNVLKYRNTDSLCKDLAQVLVLAALVAVSSARPRFLVIPLEDVEFEGGMMPRLPVYRMPAGLARQARAAQDEDSYQSAPYVPYADDAQPRDAQASGR